MPVLPDDPEANDIVPFRIVLRNGITITGKLSDAALLNVIRDPSNLHLVEHQLPAGSAVAIVLPPSPIDEYSTGDLA